MTTVEPPRPHTLIIRIWPEPREVAGQGGEWRGELREVASGSVRYFRGLDGLGPLVREIIEREDE
ncbi:MAG TPA: hypothetical protein VFE05_06150 [Longimicrobiaceae bacterium]|jgi:hypothetical protein|nr:hypothetical protein [Longimicrobiaceae bacterium]